MRLNILIQEIFYINFYLVYIPNYKESFYSEHLVQKFSLTKLTTIIQEPH